MKHDTTERRRAYIETQLLWGDGVTAQDLGEAFGIARQNAQPVLKAYRQRHPENLHYDARRKRWVKSEEFTAHHIQEDPYLFLDYQRGMALAGYFHAADDWADLPFQDADRLLRPHLDDEAMKAVLAALRQRRAVEVAYLAKKGRRQYVLSPHHLIYADNRYHVRAFCHARQAGLDYVLSRIQHAAMADEDFISESHDAEWNAVETLSFRVNPALPEDARVALRQAYRLEDGEALAKTVRKALSEYVVRRMVRPDAALNLPLWAVGEE